MYQSIKNNLIQHKNKMTITAFTVLTYLNTNPVFAAGQIQGRLNSVFSSIANLILSLIVAGGIAATGWQAFQKMWVADDPQQKTEGKQAIVRVWLYVGVAAAARWIVPAIFDLFS